MTHTTSSGKAKTRQTLAEAFPELALLNDIPRVWDSGKIRFVKPHPINAAM